MRGRALTLAVSLLSVLVALARPAAAEGAGLDPGLAPGDLVIVKTSGGGDFQGRVFAILEDRLELLTSEGEIIALAKASLQSVERRDATRDQAEYFQDSASNRLILMPTGFGMEAHEFHIAAQEIVVITGSYGMSPDFSVWGGISIPGAVVNLRYSLPFAGGGLSVGSFVGGSWMDSVALALPYTLVSLGHPNRNVTFGAGVPVLWTDTDGLRPVGAVAAIGGKAIVSATASLVSENWIIAVSDGWAWSRLQMYFFPAVVFRIAGSRFSWDIGAAIALALYSTMEGQVVFEGAMGGQIIPVPILSVTYRID